MLRRWPQLSNNLLSGSIVGFPTGAGELTNAHTFCGALAEFERQELAHQPCDRCLYRKLNSTIRVVKATHDWLRCDAACVLDGTMDRCVFAKGPMSPQLVVVSSILRQDPT